jgi:hypothetical protein
MKHESSLPYSQANATCSPEEASLLRIFLNILFFHGEELLGPRTTPKLEDYPLSAVRNCLLNLFAATLHIGGRSSIRNLRTRHAVVAGGDAQLSG